MSITTQTALARRYGPRWAFFMREAQISTRLAQTAPTAKLKRLWLDQAWRELERAGEAAHGVGG